MRAVNFFVAVRWAYAIRRCFVGVALLCLTHAALAQNLAQTTPENFPGSAEPGRRERPTPSLPDPSAELELKIELPAGVKPPAALLQKTFTLKGIRLEGVTAYSEAELAGLYKQLIGKIITFGQFYAIAEAIQARYHLDGYFLSFAFVPPQKARGGVLRIAVIEGFIDDVKVTGVEKPIQRIIESTLRPVLEERPVRLPPLERRLLLAGQLAGVTATGVLRRSEKSRGASELVVQATHVPVNGGLGVNNRASEFTGPWRYGGSVSVNALAPLAERVAANVTIANGIREFQSLDLSYEQRIGVDGLRFRADFGVSKSWPGFTLEQFDTKTQSAEGELNLTYPILLQRNHSLTAGLGLSYLNTEVELLGDRFTRDRIRTAQAVISFTQTGFLGGRNGGVLELTQGLPTLAASDPDKDAMSRGDTEPDFTMLTLDLVHARALGRRFDLFARTTGQYSFTPLPASHEFDLGGEDYGRAFNSGELTGELGAAVSVEIGYDVKHNLPRVGRTRPYLFADYGVAWNEETSSSLGSRLALGSTGLGFQVDLFNTADMRMEYAIPLARTPSNEGDRNGRFFFFLNTRF